MRVHDVGLRLWRNEGGEVGFEVIVGGGLGRTPMIGKTLREFLPKDELLAYLEAALRVYNRYGRRDNLYKARIKILVHEIGAEKMREEVEAEYAAMKDSALKLAPETIEAIASQFAPPPLPVSQDWSPAGVYGGYGAKRAAARLTRTEEAPCGIAHWLEGLLAKFPRPAVGAHRPSSWRTRPRPPRASCRRRSRGPGS